MIGYKLSNRLTLKRNSLKVLRFVSSKQLDYKVFKMQVGPQSYFQKNLMTVPSNFCNGKRNYSSGDSLAIDSSFEAKEMECIKVLLRKCLDEAMGDQNMHQGSLVSNTVIQQLCNTYSMLSPGSREKVLLYICCQYGVDHSKVLDTCKVISSSNKLNVSNNH